MLCCPYLLAVSCCFSPRPCSSDDLIERNFWACFPVLEVWEQHSLNIDHTNRGIESRSCQLQSHMLHKLNPASSSERSRFNSEHSMQGERIRMWMFVRSVVLSRASGMLECLSGRWFLLECAQAGFVSRRVSRVKPDKILSLTWALWDTPGDKHSCYSMPKSRLDSQWMHELIKSAQAHCK